MREAVATMSVLPGVNKRAQRFAREVVGRCAPCGDEVGARGMSGYVADAATKKHLTDMVNAIGGTGRTPRLPEVEAAQAALGQFDPWDDWSYWNGYDKSATLWEKLTEQYGRALAGMGLDVAAQSGPVNAAAAARAREALNVSDSPLDLGFVLGKQTGEDITKDPCAFLPGPLGWACANPGKAAGLIGGLAGLAVLANVAVNAYFMGRGMRRSNSVRARRVGR